MPSSPRPRPPKVTLLAVVLCFLTSSHIPLRVAG